MSQPNPFTLKVIEVVRSIPKGKVATYQQVAALSGKEHASRAVSWILSSCAKKYKLPWQRVISKQGRIAFKADTHHFKLQRTLLRREGVEVDAKNGEIEMTEFQWKKKPRAPRRKRGTPHMFRN